MLNGGEPIGIISPDTRLIGEIYIPSKDISYLHTRQEVSLLVDAFPSREWGPVKAEIYEISKDYIWMNQQVVYRVRCHLPQTRLVLRNGYEGELLKGMTFQARYRWEIAPLSDLFLVYTRGSNLPRDSFDSYPDLIEQTWNQPIVDTFAFRLRYRFGS